MTASPAVWGRRWFQLADVVGRPWPYLGMILRDGKALLAFDRLAIVPLGAFLAGVIVGLLRLGGGPAYTSSLLTLSVLTACGALGGGVGAAAWLGWVLVDAPVHQLRVGLHAPAPALFALAVLISWVVLFQGIALGPALATWLRMGVVRLVPSQPGRRFAAVPLQVALTWAIVRLWTLSTPVLIRPLAEWSHTRLPTQAVQPLQAGGSLIAGIAAAVTLVRMLIESAAAFRKAPELHAAAPRTAAATQAPRTPSGLARVVEALVKGGFFTVMLSGAIDSLVEGAIVWLAIVALWLTCGQLYAQPRLAQVRARLVAVPIAVRMIAASLIAFPLAWLVIPAVQALQRVLPRVLGRAGDSYLPLVVVALLSFAIVILLLPETSGGARARGAVP